VSLFTDVNFPAKSARAEEFDNFSKTDGTFTSINKKAANCQFPGEYKPFDAALVSGPFTSQQKCAGGWTDRR
jgi:hypothetical protein